MDPQNLSREPKDDAVAKPRHRWTTDEEWEVMRDTITQLYHRDGHELKTIRAIIELEYGFTATIAMYKKRLHRWGLSKALSAEEKQRLGQMAEALIAEGKSLPLQDETGNTIPWARVRTFYGTDKIPLHALPVTVRRPKRSTQLAKGQRIQSSPTQAINFPRDAFFEHQLKMKSIQIALQQNVPQYQFSRQSRYEETIIFHVKEWYSWCAVLDHPGSNSALTHLNGRHVELHSRATAGKTRSMPQALLHQARAVQEAIKQPSAMLLSTLFGIWGLTQSHIYQKHGAVFTNFLSASCNDILGPENPLCKIVSVLKEQANLLHSGASSSTEIVDSSLSIVPTALIDGLESFCRTRDQSHQEVKLQPYFLESLDEMMTWNLDACNPIAGIKLMKSIFNRRITMLRHFLQFTSRNNYSEADPTASHALVRLLEQQIKIREAVDAHNHASLPLKHRARNETFCTSLKSMAEACGQLTDYTWLKAVNQAKDGGISFEETDCFAGMMFYFQKLTPEEKQRYYGKSLAEGFDPNSMRIPQWRSTSFDVFWNTIDGVQVDKSWFVDLTLMAPSGKGKMTQRETASRAD